LTDKVDAIITYAIVSGDTPRTSKAADADSKVAKMNVACMAVGGNRLARAVDLKYTLPLYVLASYSMAGA
jgi:hypothetical protein